MCGCKERQEKLNRWRPGLGDRVAVVAEPIKGAYVRLLKPDATAVLGLVVGAFVLPWVIAQVQRNA